MLFYYLLPINIFNVFFTCDFGCQRPKRHLIVWSPAKQTKIIDCFRQGYGDFFGREKKNKYKSETQWRKRKEELNNSKMLEVLAKKTTMRLMKRESQISIAVICDKLGSLGSRTWNQVIPSSSPPWTISGSICLVPPPLFFHCLVCKITVDINLEVVMSLMERRHSAVFVQKWYKDSK